MTTLDFSGVSDAFAQIERESQERLLKAAEHNDVLRNALRASSSEALQAAIAQREQTAAAAGAGQQSAAAAGGVAALGVAYTKVREEVQKQLDLATREVEAVKARGEAGIAHAAALGDEQAKREAIVTNLEAPFALPAQVYLYEDYLKSVAGPSPLPPTPEGASEGFAE